ncbi:MAG: glycosyltransferase family 4 protein, partial [Flavobacterium sp.]
DILNQIHLLIVGREGKMSSSLLQQVADAGLQKKVSFLGHRTDIPALLKMADIFVFPSRFEGLPGVLIEAEASGLPIICTDLPMMREVVSVNKNALVFELDNEQQLANAIEKLVTDKSVRKAFAIRSKEIFKNNFEIASVHERMLSLYQKLIIR